MIVYPVEMFYWVFYKYVTKDSVQVVAYDGHYDLYDSISCEFPLEFLFEPAEIHTDWYKNKCEAEEKKRQAEKDY